jgi:5'(3')-deoxyribonucleotidase
MPTLAIDMDGVLANVLERFMDLDAQDFGRRKTLEEIGGISELDAFARAREYVRRDGFFRSLPVMPNSQVALEKLNRVYDVFIVSAATEFPQSLCEKHAWLAEHFPFISWEQIVLCGSKRIVRADIMIDDHLKNLDPFPGTTYLFTAPHNANVKSNKHIRVNSWVEMERRLL